MLQTQVRFVDHTTEFIAKSAVATDSALAFMGQDIEIKIKTGGKTPFKKGKLRGDTYHEKLAVGKYRVNVPVEYAAVQEKGSRAGATTFRNYTTPGTGAHFFADAVNGVVTRVETYAKMGKQSAGII